MKIKTIAIIILVLLATGAVLTWQSQQTVSPTPEIPNDKLATSFEECVNMGNPVMESYPRQCRSGDKTFVENIGNEIEKMDIIRIDSPRPNEVIKSPLVITGEARGGWYFEANFPISLKDANGVIIAEWYAEAQGEWMTNEFVPFRATLDFTTPASLIGKKGTLILSKSNASGLPEHDDALEIPVSF
jgi:hypothetical protein